jgi:MoxR-like ATPase
MTLEAVEIDGVRLKLAAPMENRAEWIGQREVLKQLLACWLVVDDSDLPLTPRLVGVPGIGKTALAMAAAAQRKQELYVFQCTADTRPEDLLVTPVLSQNGTIAYHASPLVTAMIRGAVCVILGQPGSTIRSASLCGIDRRWHRRESSQELSMCGNHESRRFHL